MCTAEIEEDVALRAALHIRNRHNSISFTSSKVSVARPTLKRKEKPHRHPDSHYRQTGASAALGVKEDVLQVYIADSRAAALSIMRHPYSMED